MDPPREDRDKVDLYREERHADAAQTNYLIGKLIRRMERIMRTLEDVLDVVTAQRSKIDSLGALTAGIKKQLDEALAGALTPSQQMRVDAIFNRLGENTAAVVDAIEANDGDPNTPVPLTLLTRTTVSSSNNRTNVGDPVTFSAGVERDPTAPADKVLSGSVAFSVDGTEVGSAAIDPDGVGVSAPVTSLTAGDHAVIATYGGNASFASSASEAITQTVVGAVVDPVNPNPVNPNPIDPANPNPVDPNAPQPQNQPQQQPQIDPATGQVLNQNQQSQNIDPATGRPFVDGQNRNAQGQTIDPVTGQPVV